MNHNYTKLHNPSSNDIMIRDWRKALRTPPTYRIGNRTFRFHVHIALMALCFGALLLMFYYLKPTSSPLNKYDNAWFRRNQMALTTSGYNYTYPLSTPITSNGMQTYRIAIIADLDKASKHPQEKNKWRSYYKKGYLSFTSSKESVVVSFDKENAIEIDGGFALNGRGMELSELVTFNGRILTFDDRTGLVYELLGDRVIPWIVLMDGDGRASKGFKSEWATVKDEILYVGSMGKEWTTAAGEFGSYDPMYVKAVTMTGEVTHIKWVDNYMSIRRAIGIEWPGYMIHESGMWSAVNRKWYFLPRRCSKERYNETRDEYMGCNVLISTEENFNNVEVVNLGPNKPTQGFSSFKFVPGTNDQVIVALQTEEINGKTATYITAFTLNGKILMEQIKLDTDYKYEGIEFT